MQKSCCCKWTCPMIFVFWPIDATIPSSLLTAPFSAVQRCATHHTRTRIEKSTPKAMGTRDGLWIDTIAGWSSTTIHSIPTDHYPRFTTVTLLGSTMSISHPQHRRKHLDCSRAKRLPNDWSSEKMASTTPFLFHPRTKNSIGPPVSFSTNVPNAPGSPSTVPLPPPS